MCGYNITLLLYSSYYDVSQIRKINSNTHLLSLLKTQNGTDHFEKIFILKFIVILVFYMN